MSESNKGYLAQIVPVLPVMDVLKALEFYVQKLGFSFIFIDNEKTPRYAVVKRDNITLHLQWHDSEAWKDNKDRPMLRIEAQAIKRLYEEYKLKGVFHNHTALEEKPWKTLEFAFYDPFKNGLVFYHIL